MERKGNKGIIMENFIATKSSIKYWVQEAVVPTLFIVGMLAIVAGVFALQAMRYGGIL